MIPSFAAPHVSRRRGGRGATDRIFQLVPWLCYDSLSNGVEEYDAATPQAPLAIIKPGVPRAIKIRYANSLAYFSIMVYCACRLLHARRTPEGLDELISREWTPRCAR